MPNARARSLISMVLAVISLASFVRSVGFYVGPGPHDGEDLPSYMTFVAGSAALFAAVLVSRSGRRGRWRLIGACLSGVLLLITVAWWVLNVELERWAG